MFQSLKYLLSVFQWQCLLTPLAQEEEDPNYKELTTQLEIAKYPPWRWKTERREYRTAEC